MKKLFEKLSLAQFKLLSIFIAFVSDVYICTYIYKTFIDKEYFDKSLEVAFQLVKHSNPNVYDPSLATPEFFAMMWERYHQIIVSMLALYLVIHGLIFLAAKFDKKMARSYIKFYSASASALMILFSLFGLGNPWNIGFLILGIIHLFNYKGIKYFKI